MSHGEFSGDPRTLWVTEGDEPDRTMRLLEDFWFIDPQQKEWRTRAIYPIDGASIPRALWTVVGSPYTGDYRRASIVHDKACDDAQGNPAARRAADRMFFHACRAGGCSISAATLLYIGVRIGALSPLVAAWHEGATAAAEPRASRTAGEKRLEADFELAAREVLGQGTSDDPKMVERRTDAALNHIAGINLQAAERRLARRGKKSSRRRTTMKRRKER
jgi:hypothetical protein